MSKGNKAVVAAAVVGVVAAGGLAVALAWTAEDTKVSEVATFAQQDVTIAADKAVTRTVDGVGFPDWSRWGWKPVGGRADESSTGRDIGTVVYRKGDDTIAYSVISGTKWVNGDLGGRIVYRSPPEGKTELVLSSVDDSVVIPLPDDECANGSGCTSYSRTATTVTRHVDDRTVVLTAWPVSEALTTEAQDMALRR